MPSELQGISLSLSDGVPSPAPTPPDGGSRVVVEAETLRWVAESLRLLSASIPDAARAELLSVAAAVDRVLSKAAPPEPFSWAGFDPEGMAESVMRPRLSVILGKATLDAIGSRVPFDRAASTSVRFSQPDDRTPKDEEAHPLAAAPLTQRQAPSPLPSRTPTLHNRFGETDLRHRRKSLFVALSQQEAGGQHPDPRLLRRASQMPASRQLALHERQEFPYVVVGAMLLAAVAGWVNIVALTQYKLGVSHATGNTSQLARTMVQESWRDFAVLASLITAFCVGSCISGAAVGNGKFVLGRKYGNVLVTVGGLVFVGTLALHRAPRCAEALTAEQCGSACVWDAGRCVEGRGGVMGLLLWALAMGIQNGMATSFSGAVVRTTHVTGIVTDLGLTVGHWLRKQRLGTGGADTWKLQLHGPILAAFFAGGSLGVYTHARFGVLSVLCPALVLLAGGTLYNVGRQWGAFNMFLEENYIQEKIEKIGGAVTSAVASRLEEAAADGTVEAFDDDLGLEPAEGDGLAMSPVFKLAQRRRS